MIDEDCLTDRHWVSWGFNIGVLPKAAMKDLELATFGLFEKKEKENKDL